MRVLPAAVLAASLALGSTQLAAASCAPPVSVAENAARAAVVIHGTVTAAGGGAITVQVDRVLKGDVRTPLRAFIGPARGGAFAPVATSVDYAATAGSDHVLYLTRGTDGELETNACGGSHAGRPTDSETAFFGAGTTPAEQPDGTPMWVGLGALAVATVALVLWMFRWRRVARGTSIRPA